MSLSPLPTEMEPIPKETSLNDREESQFKRLDESNQSSDYNENDFKAQEDSDEDNLKDQMIGLKSERCASRSSKNDTFARELDIVPTNKSK